MAEGFKLHKVVEVYFTLAPVNNYAVNITETLDSKMAALRAHMSQVADHVAELEQWLRSLAAEAGQRHGFAYAEEFHRAENN